MGGRIGYSAATGVMVILLSWFGVISLMTALIPVVAISPILLYIGMLIGSQAFQESPHRHAPAIVVALIPSMAAWAKLQIDNSLGAVSGIHHVTPEMMASMMQVGIFYHGLAVLGGGSILAGVVLGAITTFITDREFAKASGFAAAGAVLTFLGLMHGEEVGAFQNPEVVVAYLAVAGVLLACSRFAVVAPLAAEEPHHELEHAPAE
jgi:adenine/guanine/hypoxanthine permease